MTRDQVVEHCEACAKVKASGNIGSRAKADALLAAGTSLLGTSSAVAITTGARPVVTASYRVWADSIAKRAQVRRDSGEVSRIPLMIRNCVCYG